MSLFREIIYYSESFLTFDGDSSDTFFGAETVASSGSIRTSVACLDLFDNNFVAAIGASVSVDSDASIFLQINSILETVQKEGKLEENIENG